MMPPYKPRTQTAYAVLHCSATKPDMDIGASDIRRWHIERGWIDIGYHYVIRLDGSLEYGRPQDVVGSHCKGVNWKSIGICLVGGLDSEGNPANTYNEAQLKTLRGIVRYLKAFYPSIEIKAHREFNDSKDCPCATVEELLYDTPSEDT